MKYKVYARQQDVDDETGMIYHKLPIDFGVKFDYFHQANNFLEELEKQGNFIEGQLYIKYEEVP